MTPTDPTGPGDPLDPVVADYLQQVEAGTPPDRDKVLAMHPDLADRLNAFFADLDRFGKQASAFRLPGADSTVSSDGSAGTDLPRVRYVGDYELLEEVARGGMGVVFKARQVSLNRVVALKMILAGTYATDAARRRFEQEAEAAAGLDHPNILPIYEVGEHEGHQYFSMKLVEETPWPAESPRMAIRGLSQVARAVHYAHQRGILHRDLKPSNILLDHDGTPYVTDFGLAKKVDAEDGRTRTGAVVGTPAYMAPEQARGEKGLTTAVDVYSLGAILYESLTGRPPFHGETALDTLRQVTDRDPDHPRAVNPRADRDLAVVALKCLEKDPARRYPSAAALADDLDRWARGEPIEARAATRRERAVKWARRNPLGTAFVAFAGVAAVVVVGLLVVALQQANRAIHREADAVNARNDAVEQKQIAEQRLRDATVEQARSARLMGNRGRAMELLAQAGRSKVTPELELEAVRVVTTFGVGLVAKTPGRGVHIVGGPGPFVAFSADGSLFAAPDHFYLDPEKRTGETDGVLVYETATGKVVARVEGYYSGKFAFHPAKPVLAIGRQGRVILHDVPTGTETDLGPGGGPVCFDPAGRLLAAAGPPARQYDAPVTVFDLAGGPPRRLGVTGHPLHFTPEGLVVQSYKPTAFHLWDVAADRSVARSPDGWRPISVDPAARRAVLFDKDNQHAVWDLRAGKLLWRLPKLQAAYYRDAVPFSPTEPLVAYEPGLNTRTIELFDVAAGRVHARLMVPGRGPQALLYGRFNPDGTILSVESDYQGDVTLWEVGTGRLLATLPDHSKAHWSPDGRHLVTFASVGWVDLGGGERSRGSESHLRIYAVTPLPARTQIDRPAERVTFNADGTELAAADTVWRVTRVHGRPHLVRAGQVGEKRTAFFDAAGRRWAFPLRETLKPDTPYTLERLSPDQWAVRFPGRPHRGFEHTPDAGKIEVLFVTPDGKRAILLWSGFKEAPKGDTSRTPWAQVEYWDLDGPKLLGKWLESNGIDDFRSLTLSPDGTRLVATGNLGLQVWDATTGKRLTRNWTPGHRGSMRQVAFTADTRHVVAGYDDGWVALLRPDGQKVVEHRAHEGDLTALAVGPGGRFIASAADDRTVAIWDAATLTRLAQWEIADGKVTALAFAPDGRTLAVGDAKGVVQVWDVPAVLDELTGLGFKARE
jgi:WD40 repeat protein